MPIPIMTLIDVEPDPRMLDLDDPAPWRGYEASTAYFDTLRDKLAQATGSPVHFNWFFRMDPQVSEVYGDPAWPIRQYSSAVRSHAGHGDEIGLHTHAYRWEKEHERWIVDHGNPEWIAHCLDMSFKTFTETLNRPCDSFRFGDRFISTEIMAHVERLGAKYELTVEPGSPPGPHFVPTEAFTGWLPDCRDAPVRPYRYSAENWKKPDPARNSGMLVLPLSSGVPESWKGQAKRKLLRVFGRAVEAPTHLTLRLDRHAPTIALILDRLLHDTEHPYLTLLMRTDTAIHERDRRNLDGVFDHILNHRYVRDFVFTRPGEALDHLGYS